ncbi:hypothetical protein [Shewanella chilikensis]|uniref:hypothetical protein n=1 Tax=Shewanella chilikensis TaxID=558541 RepID=UPI001F47C4DA|nr:hypothetical protein [Shewanella chilikensis]MCE9786133.1 hypothetical protein [Shewanella chilikensis]
MNLMIAIFLFTVVTTALIFEYKHTQEYAALYKELESRGVVHDSWKPSWLVGASSWGYRLKLKDIESFFGKEKLTEREVMYIDNARKYQFYSYSTILLGTFVAVIFSQI